MKKEFDMPENRKINSDKKMQDSKRPDKDKKVHSEKRFDKDTTIKSGSKPMNNKKEQAGAKEPGSGRFKKNTMNQRSMEVNQKIGRNKPDADKKVQGNSQIDGNKYESKNRNLQESNKFIKNSSVDRKGNSDRKTVSTNNKTQKNEFLDGNKQRGRNVKQASLCPVIKKCGGCQLLDISYEQQLKTKQKRVEELFQKFAKVEPIIGMDNPYHYRNKVHAVFDHDRKGNPISGVYEAGTHRVVPVESCMIEDEKADAIIGTIRGMLKSFKIKTYDEDSDFGLLRHVLIRKGFNSGQIMVVLVLASPILPSKSNFIKALLKQHPEITTIVINVNNKKTSMVLGEKEQVIYGKGYIEDSLCGKVFRISPKSFYQVNTAQTEILYGKAIELAGLTGKEIIVDAYCGIGTIGLIASDYAEKVIGVELNQDAVRDANTNASRNKIANVDFYNKDAGEFMGQMAAQGQSVDIIFMDPPRAGSDEKFLSSLCTLAPGRIVYISCNPETLERDVKYLVKNKYKVERVIPVDMFPGTEHVEVVLLLVHK
jgi:23S rRNA (uracil1939-C5)-methyltransferase